MVDLDALEKAISEKMQETIATADPGWLDRVSQLSSLGKRLAEAKREVLRIQAALNEAPSVNGSNLSGLSLSSYDLEISQGDINQNLFRTSILKKLNLVPSQGIHFKVQASTPVGEISFKTEIDPISGSRLKSRSEIAQFYRESSLKAGDKVRWEKLDPVTYRICKI